LETLLELKTGLFDQLPNYISLEDKLEILIEALQSATGQPVDLASEL
jgi:hypothetical protein